MRFLTYALFAFLLTAGSPVNAQLAPAWTAPTGAVQWMRTTAAGALVVCAADGLKGVDPATGTIAWTLADLAAAPEQGYEEVSNSPFITLVPAGRPEDMVIVEPFSGTVVFNSAEAGISRIVNTYFLYPNQAIILVGQKADKTAAMACVDMGTGKVRWTKDDQFSRLIACNSVGPKELVLSTLFFAYKFNTDTGEELWKKSPDPDFERMAGLAALLDKGGANLGGALTDGINGVFLTTPFAPELCFMGVQSTTLKTVTDSKGNTKQETVYETFINAFRMSDGAYAWARPLEMPQMLGAIVPLRSGLLVGAGNKRSVDLLDYNTGEGLWGKKGKGINVKGVLSGAVAVGDRTLLTSDGSDGVVALVDALGEEVWAKPLKLKGVVQRVAILGSDLLVASAEEVEIVDLATGASRLDKTFQGGAGLVASAADKEYVLSTKDGLLYAVSQQGGAVSAVSSTPLEFEGKEVPTAMAPVAEGLVVTSDQNITLIGMDGTVSYRKHFPAPRESGLVRALKYASAVRAAYYTAAYGYTSAAFGAASQSIQVTDANSAMGKELTGAISEVYAQGAEAGMEATKRFFREANARFKASASTNDKHFMMTTAGNKTYELKAIDKRNGTVTGSIPLGQDKEPRYEVDGFTNTVYLAEGGAVKAYKL